MLQCDFLRDIAHPQYLPMFAEEFLMLRFGLTGMQKDRNGV